MIDLAPPSGRRRDDARGAGLSVDCLQLALKTLHFAGELTGTDLAAASACASRSSSRRSIAAARNTTSRSSAARCSAALVQLSDHRRRAHPGDAVPRTEPLRRRGAGAVRAVPRYMRAFNAQCAAARRRASASAARFSHLVLSDRVLDQLGPAVNAGHSLFIYGPPGNGKTVIAQEHPQPARRRHRDSARDRGRGPHRSGLRSGHPRGARWPTTQPERLDDRTGSPTAAGCAAGGRW